MTEPHDAAQPKQARAACPYCGSDATEPLALFGMQLLTVQMYCQRCHTPFEYVKDDAILNRFGARHAQAAQEADKGEQA